MRYAYAPVFSLTMATIDVPFGSHAKFVTLYGNDAVNDRRPDPSAFMIDNSVFANSISGTVWVMKAIDFPSGENRGWVSGPFVDVNCVCMPFVSIDHRSNF